MRISDRYQVIGLLALTLSVYYTAISGGINSVDDVHILEKYGINGHATLKDILFPGSGFYYRPFIELTYFLDYQFWGHDRSFMHLENILLHCGNVLLVYFIAWRLVNSFAPNFTSLPFVSAALFALHPINTEAVSWIAGRTDPLAAFFVLLATLLLLICFETSNIFILVLSLMCAILGALAKETAILFLPLSLFLLARWPASALSERLRKFGLFILGSCSVGFVLLLLVQFLRKNSADALLMVFDFSQWEKNHSSLVVALKALGFYAKKLFFPLPLNFAIASIHDAYALIGVLVFICIACAACRKSFNSFFAVASFIFIAPAIIVSVAGITWTPVAERYLYLPSAFFSISFVGYVLLVLERVGRPQFAVPALSLLLIPAGAAVVDRNGVWQDNVSLYRDTVAKSPDFAPVRNELAVALIRAGKVEEGRAELQVARSLKGGNAEYLIAMNLLAQELDGLPPAKARELLLPKIQDRGSADVQVLRMLAKVDEALLAAEKDPGMISQLAVELVDINNTMYLKQPDPFFLYRNGQLSIVLRETKAAADYFRRAADSAPEGRHYKAAAERLAVQLGK